MANNGGTNYEHFRLAFERPFGQARKAKSYTGAGLTQQT